ncbi:helix-turn-helix domain-containing protein [Allosalinactinospora lopnorensis]|uniref:helix-turn-helix domain-containing protein n=1 Tax=Allosalinactinospora lopnorensis TaxID=1352348 RepID=UPI000623C6E6|nr:helix-turn-helix domain-containing protein [Allosalinactinospora lopnorensis]
MPKSDLLEPSGPNASLRGRVHRPTVYRPAPDAPPHHLRRGSDGHVYGWVRMAPASEEAEPCSPGRLGSDTTGSGTETSEEGAPVRPPTIEDLEGYDQRPNPLEAQTPAEFVQAMRRFRTWSGDWSYRELERFCGGAVPRSTFHAALTGDELPKFVVLMAFVSACGGNQDEVQRWVTGWRRLRMSETGDGSAAGLPPGASP